MLSLLALTCWAQRELWDQKVTALPFLLELVPHPNAKVTLFELLAQVPELHDADDMLEGPRSHDATPRARQ